MMQPYATPFYFVILGLALLPLVIAHLLGRKWMPYQVLVTIILLWLTFGGSVSLWALIGFGIFETAIIKFYEHYRKRKNNKTWVFVLTVLISIVPIFMVKVTPVIDPTHPFSIFGFLGISYVTFKTVNIILELRDGLIKEIPIKEFLYFLYFYPTISSGPIDRFRRFHKELTTPFDKENYLSQLDKGIFYIFLGFLYNFIIAYFIGHNFLNNVTVSAIRTPGLVNMLEAMYGYGLYLFFDFAGYSLFAIGVSYIMGYDIPHNFNKPFSAKNIKDFWNRWHMSLSFWFRDFVFMRFVKWIMVKKWSKNMVKISNLAYLANMGLMGFWHGLTWFYILYGFYHGFLMIGYDAWLRLKKKHKWKAKSKYGKWVADGLAVFITINLVFVGFLIFSGIPDLVIKHALHLPAPAPRY